MKASAAFSKGASRLEAWGSWPGQWAVQHSAQWTTIGSHLEQVGSGSIHAENWHHVLRIWGGWGIGMIMWLHPWWVDSSPFIYLSISMFVVLLHFVPVNFQQNDALCQTNNQWGSGASYEHQRHCALCWLVQIFLPMSPHPTHSKKSGKPIGSSNLRGLTGLTKYTGD